MKGFTLVELLVVIAVLALLSTFAVPNVIKYFNIASEKAFESQVIEIEDAAKMYLQDYCKQKISSSYVCPLTRNSDNTYTGTIEDVNILVNTEYLETLTYKGSSCTGSITFTNDIPVVSITCGKYSSS